MRGAGDRSLGGTYRTHTPPHLHTRDEAPSRLPLPIVSHCPYGGGWQAGWLALLWPGGASFFPLPLPFPLRSPQPARPPAAAAVSQPPPARAAAAPALPPPGKTLPSRENRKSGRGSCSPPSPRGPPRPARSPAAGRPRRRRDGAEGGGVRGWDGAGWTGRAGPPPSSHPPAAPAAVGGHGPLPSQRERAARAPRGFPGDTAATLCSFSFFFFPSSHHPRQYSPSQSRALIRTRACPGSHGRAIAACIPTASSAPERLKPIGQRRKCHHHHHAQGRSAIFRKRRVDVP